MTAVRITGGLKRLLSIPRGRVTVGAVGVALLATWPFGGLKESREAIGHAHPMLANHSVNVAPFRISVVGTTTYTKLTKTEGDGTVSTVFQPDHPGELVMMLKVDVVNTSPRPVEWRMLEARSADDLVTLSQNVIYIRDRSAPSATAPEQVYDLDDATEVGSLNPGVTYHLGVVWSYPGPAQATVQVGLAELAWKPDPFSGSVDEWFDPNPTATLTVPVTDKTAAAS